MLEAYLKELNKITLLTPEEERKLWQSYKDNGDMASRSRLIERYQPLVFKETMRWHIRPDLLADAVQEGTLGLIEAVERFDYKRNVAFPLYAVHRIRGEIVDYLNKEGRRTALSLDEPDEHGMTLRDNLPDDSEDLADRTGRRILFEHVSGILSRLPEKEQIVVEGVYLQDKQQKHIARDMDVSLPYVYRLQKRGIRRVRGMLSRFIHDSKDK
ncbi:MAG: sigma-70 family RNA polymerase sigma factor [Megasphaera sp.]|jgi:RNA polymerase sporulation-specific sigma factor|nr:sigma-70 family RNA polymerase sigma factor [Megasphaera sp.]MCH4187108.1 sigma-70 family RNA polymerase sigma factor [Megasphaera sp.]MCH4216956.1 sigma-70 family RNA polymerase sigma factor [Megasphaera sp.]